MDTYVEDLGGIPVTPSLVIDGITSVEEVEYFRNRLCDADKSLPLFYQDDTGFVEIGKLELSLNSLLTLKNIYDYKLKLYKTPDVFVDLDLNDPKVLIKFIRI